MTNIIIVVNVHLVTITMRIYFINVSQLVNIINNSEWLPCNQYNILVHAWSVRCSLEEKQIFFIKRNCADHLCDCYYLFNVIITFHNDISTVGLI